MICVKILRRLAVFVEKLQVIPHVSFSILVGVVLVYAISKYFHAKLIANLEVRDLYILNFGNRDHAIFAIKLGEYLGRPVLLSRVHQTSAYWLPFFVFVAEFDPGMMDENIVKTLFVKKFDGKKLFLIEDTNGGLKVYAKRAGIMPAFLFLAAPEGGEGGVVFV